MKTAQQTKQDSIIVQQDPQLLIPSPLTQAAIPESSPETLSLANNLIYRAIHLLSRKVLDLIEICNLKQIDLSEYRTFTHLSHDEWSQNMLDIYFKLKSNEETQKTKFTKALDLISLKLQVQMGGKQSPIKNLKPKGKRKGGGGIILTEDDDLKNLIWNTKYQSDELDGKFLYQSPQQNQKKQFLEKYPQLRNSEVTLRKLKANVQKDIQVRSLRQSTPQIQPLKRISTNSLIRQQLKDKQIVQSKTRTNFSVRSFQNLKDTTKKDLQFNYQQNFVETDCENPYQGSINTRGHNKSIQAKDLSHGAKLEFENLMASNGGYVIIEKEDTKHITLEDQEPHLPDDKADLQKKMVIVFDGQIASQHKNGLSGAVHDVLNELKKSNREKISPVSDLKSYRLGDAKGMAKQLEIQIKKMRQQSAIRDQERTRPLLKDLIRIGTLKQGVSFDLK